MIESIVSDGVCVLRLDSPPLNTISFELLEQLSAAVRRARDERQVSGIIVTGGPHHFSAGADIGIFREIGCAENAIRTSRVYQEAFREIEDCGKPVVAAVAGLVIGGALELAVACHFRVCDGRTRFSAPEVNLGINPGAGGTQRLPRLVGVAAALKMLLTGETVDARKAQALGLVDAICDGEQLITCARELLLSVTEPRKTNLRTDKIADTAVNAAAFRQAEELLEDVPAELIAPRKIIEAVRVGLEDSFGAGLRAEQEAFAECMATTATKNKIYVFFATRQTAKVPQLAEIEAVPVRKAAVVGMGTMGTGIAQALIIGGIPVVVCDQDDSALQRGMDRIRTSTEKRVAQGKLSPEKAERTLGLISTSSDWQAMADADLVIESVFEQAETKRTVIDRLEDICRGETILATNTSTISLDRLAQGMRCPERLMGMHFFNPAQRMPLVEIIRREDTAPWVVATALQLAQGIRKTPVLVNNREGFLVNRIFVPYLKEAFWLLQQGAEPAVIDAAMVEFGFAMGPLTLIDMAGLDILVAADEVLAEAFPRHGSLSQIAVRLVEQGHLGQKTGSGVYRYLSGSYAPHQSDAAAAIIAQTPRQGRRTLHKIRNDEITQRLVLRMVNEAFYVMQEGVAQRESDVDVAMVLGTGFPDYRGGVLRYARDMGLETALAWLEKLAERYGERFAPCELMREMKGR